MPTFIARFFALLRITPVVALSCFLALSTSLAQPKDKSDTSKKRADARKAPEVGSKKDTRSSKNRDKVPKKRAEAPKIRRTRLRSSQESAFRKINRLGDVSWRVDLSADILFLSTTTGELFSDLIGQRSIQNGLTIQYSYYAREKLSLIGSALFMTEYNTATGLFFSNQVALGARWLPSPFFFTDAQVTFDLFRRSEFGIGFAGFLFGVGFGFFVHDRARIVLSGQGALRFLDGLELSLRVSVGTEIFF